MSLSRGITLVCVRKMSRLCAGFRGFGIPICLGIERCSFYPGRTLTLSTCFLGLFLLAPPALAQERSSPAGAAIAEKAAGQDANPDWERDAALHGFPALFNLRGDKLADGEFTEWERNDLLHVNVAFDFGLAHHIEEKTILRQRPQLVQDEWAWSEFENGHLLRRFKVDFKQGKATAEKLERNRTNIWAETLKIEPGRTFAGIGFVLALKTVRERLVAGQKAEFRAIGFTPKPRLVTVELSYGNRESMVMAERTVVGDLFIIHPKVPALARALVDVKDTHIWLTLPRPAGFLRWEGPQVEAGDSVIRVDLLPGNHSGTAEPLRTTKSPER